MALSWWSFASNHPATITVCIGSKSYSGELIRESGCFVLNVVDGSIADAAFKCGTCSGRSVDKVEKFGIELEPSSVIPVARVKAHKVALECRVVSSMAVGDHTLFAAEVLEADIRAEANALYATNGYAGLTTL